VVLRRLIPDEYRNRIYYARQLVRVRRELLRLNHIVAAWDAARTLCRQMLMIGKTAAFCPERPHARNALFKALAVGGWNVAAENARRVNAAFVWQDATFVDAERIKPFLFRYPHAVNRKALDISKNHLERVFADVFGYGYAVEPTQHHGPLVEKGDLNAQHDGRILHGPLNTTRPDCVYLKLLNNEIEPGVIEDLRFLIINAAVHAAYRKRRSSSRRFLSSNSQSIAVDSTELASGRELARIERFCERLGLDYGELDAIRDLDDGRLYIVDANKTPFANTMLPREQQLVVARQTARAIDRWFAGRRSSGAAPSLADHASPRIPTEFVTHE
jgi:hypothetical protein